MKFITSPAQMQALARSLRADGKTIGFVPTMGAFHEGHLSLMRAARAACDTAVVSLFVNPIQFGANEDYGTYPRDLAADRHMAQAEGVDVLFAPEAADMYPKGFGTSVVPEGISEILCGAARPDHFRGVATVITKLCHLVQPHRAYLGRKDYQQALIIKRIVADLNFDVEVVICPTIREPDGLAMSSRNRYLSPEDRRAAPVLYRALQQARALYEQGERSTQTLKHAMTGVIQQEPLARPEYAEVRDAATLADQAILSRPAVALLAVLVGRTRLIDNGLLPSGGLP